MAITRLNNNSITSVTALPSGVGNGVLQVVQATTSTNTNISVDSFTDTTLSASITPQSSSNKILIITNQLGHSAENNTTGSNCNFRLMRDTTEIYQIETLYESSDNSARDQFPVSGSMVYLDSPSTTNSITYKTQAKEDGEFVLVNRESSSIILMEIAS